jgi:hypothetical protein
VPPTPLRAGATLTLVWAQASLLAASLVVRSPTRVRVSRAAVYDRARRALPDAYLPRNLSMSPEGFGVPPNGDIERSSIVPSRTFCS